jgi:hypothetical protein
MPPEAALAGVPCSKILLVLLDALREWGYGWESFVLFVGLGVWVKNALNRSLIDCKIFHRECFQLHHLFLTDLNSFVSSS